MFTSLLTTLLGTVLLVTSVITVSGQNLVNYRPRIISIGEGRITGTTFALEHPICLFANDNIDPSSSVWALVAFSNVTANIDISTINGQNIPSYQRLLQQFYYLTLKNPVSNFACRATTDLLRVLHIGIDPSCITNLNRPDCNGPLPFPGPYRVKLLVIAENGTVIAETLWSDNIFLQVAKDFSTINTLIKKRSAGMIVITTILAVLLAGLFSVLSGVFMQNCYKCFQSKPHNIQSCSTVTRESPTCQST